MRALVLFCLLGACLGDKPSPTYNAAAAGQPAQPAVATKTVVASPTTNAKNPPLSAYAAPKSDNFAADPNAPKAAAKSDTYAPPSQSVVHQPATQGYYYYYYPVSSGYQQTYSSGGHPQGGYSPPGAQHRDGSGSHGHGGGHGGGGHGHGGHGGGGGGYSGGGLAYGPGPGNGTSNLIVPLIVISGIFLALLFFGGLAGTSGTFGRSLKDSLSDLDLGINVIDAVEMARNVLDAVNGAENKFQ